MHTTPLTGVKLSAYSSRWCSYSNRPQRKPEDASGKEPKGSQQLRRCVKETATNTMLVSGGEQCIFISLYYYPPTDASIFKGLSLLQIFWPQLCAHIWYLPKLFHPDLIIQIFYEQYKVLSS
jgi:hypothetical protein